MGLCSVLCFLQMYCKTVQLLKCQTKYLSCSQTAENIHIITTNCINGFYFHTQTEQWLQPLTECKTLSAAYRVSTEAALRPGCMLQAPNSLWLNRAGLRLQGKQLLPTNHPSLLETGFSPPLPSSLSASLLPHTPPSFPPVQLSPQSTCLQLHRASDFFSF